MSTGTARAWVTGFAWLAPPPNESARDGWHRLPEPERSELDPGREDARWPRLDRGARLLALAAHRALAGRTVAGEGSGLVLGTLTGCLEADERFDATRGQDGGASPLLFPATLATAPAAELSIRLGLRGPVSVVSSGESSWLEAIAIGCQLVALGEATLVLACGLEVAARSAGRVLGRSGPFAESAGCLVLEGPSAAPRAIATMEVLPDESGACPGETPGGADFLGNRAGSELATVLAPAGSRKRLVVQALSLEIARLPG